LIKTENRIINLTESEFIEVGKRISACRKEAGMTLDEVGQLLGLHRSSVLRYENGHTKQIKLVILERLAQIFETTPEYLMSGCEAEEKNGAEANDIYNVDQNSANSTDTNSADSFTEASNIARNNATNNSPLYESFAEFGQDREDTKEALHLNAPIKYEVHVPPATLYNDEDVKKALLDNTLPYVFSYMNFSTDFSPRIIPGDVLTVRTADRCNSGDLCLLFTREHAIVLRRVFITKLGVTVVADAPSIPPESLPYLGRNSGLTIIGRITNLSANM